MKEKVGELVAKKVLSLDREPDLHLVISGLIAYGFFDHPKTIEDTAKHLFIEKKSRQSCYLK